MPRFGHQLADRGTGALRLHQIHLRAARHRQDCKQKYQHAHAADPVRKAAPEQRAVRQRLHVGNNACARRGKAGDGLKQRVRKMRNLAGKDEGQGAENTEYDPAEGDRDKALFHEERHPPRLSDDGGDTEGGAD